MADTDVPDEMPAELAADLAGAALRLATRFAAGATLWCLAPSFEPHARHIAVEFVHPVIMGKRALPAVALTGPGLVDQTRAAVRPGDVIVMVAGSERPEATEVARRAPAWGTTTVWIGHGPRPPAGAADHVLWLDDPDPRAPATGGFLLLYHLLWELTHVCFEHPGLLRAPAGDAADTCITCSDEGRLGEVVTVDPDGTATVRTAAGVATVTTTLVGPLAPGDLVLAHAGTVLTKVGEQP